MKTAIFKVMASDRIIDDLHEAIKGAAAFDIETVGGSGRTRIWIGTVIMAEVEEVKDQDESGSDPKSTCTWARIPGVTHHGCTDVWCSRDHSYGPPDPREAADVSRTAHEQPGD